jgi:poly(beta-D-mannuronate) C5 epimerase
MIILQRKSTGKLSCSCRGLLTAFLLLLGYAAPALPSRALLEMPQIRVHEAVPEHIQDERVAATDDCCEDLKNLRSRTHSIQQASVSVKTLYSAQAGSWMFESLVHNGLFRIASSYQPSHPQAIFIEKGGIDLHQLVEGLNNPRILERMHPADNASAQQSRFRLHYPLIIGSDATLFIENAELKMDSDSGTALVNLGRLVVRNSRLAPVRDNASGGKHFRPFILSWNGSETAIIDSQLDRLGYNQFLSQGLTIANHEGLSRKTRARLLLSGSVLTGLESGPIASKADLLIKENTIENTQRYGIDASDGVLTAVDNTITTTRYNDGIRATNSLRAYLGGNRISQTKKAGILVTGKVQHTVMTGNYIDKAGADGLAVRDVTSAGHHSILIRGNILTMNAKSGIRLSSAPSVRVTNNNVLVNGEYGINIDHSLSLNGQTAPEKQTILIAGNQLAGNRIAAIKTVRSGRLMLADNQFQMNLALQSVFAGDLAFMQTALLNQLIANKAVVEIIP